MYDLDALREKWADTWLKQKTFEVDASKDKPKIFVTFPYPYVNGYLHIGHFYTLMRVEAFSRFKKMQGFNTLFPHGFHATGSPIVSAAKRVADGEEKQLSILKDMGFDDEEIAKFKDPKHWPEVFATAAQDDLTKLGFSIDWRRSFITTDMNPQYDAFIRWQFLKLKEKGYVAKGKHPVVWDPKDQCPVGDHDRVEGEGETPQEFTLLKFAFGDEFIIAATLRPETVFGQTNLWVGPENEYVKATVDGETWIVSEPCAKKLEEQDKKVEVVSKIRGSDLLGRTATAPGIGREIPVLPSAFCNVEKGTGIVTSVPSDAPDDWIGLRDLQQDKALCKKWDIDPELVASIEPIPIIDSSDLGDLPAIKMIDELKIKNQHDRKKLDEAKKMVYKKGFYEGKMKKSIKEFGGMKVEQAKDAIKKKLVADGDADVLYELTGRVVARSLAECTVKIVSNQWFLKYGDQKWKKDVKKCLKYMNLFPEKSRAQFEHVIDWLNDWACAREAGLGTRLPWDEEWIIESLSDSTIYMAYYTIAHLAKDLPVDVLDEAFFDYVFLGKGKKPSVDGVDEMKAEFEYWYPVDFRNSGKDLIQNHLAFFMFNHVAIFPEHQWPQGIGANGWLTVDGNKMSKSLGNMIPLRQMVGDFTADASRITILAGGEGLDDANWESSFAKSIRTKLERLDETILELYDASVEASLEGVDGDTPIDGWLRSEVNQIIKKATAHMDLTEFRPAIQLIMFELPRVLRWYVRRCAGEKINQKLINGTISVFIQMLSPFCCFVSEEMWQQIGNEGLVSETDWPNYKADDILVEAGLGERVIEHTLKDIEQVLQLAKVDKPSSITLFVADSWKYEFLATVKMALEDTRDFKEILGRIMSTKLKSRGKEITKLLPKLVKQGSISDFLPREAEVEALYGGIAFLKAELAKKGHDLSIDVVEAEKSGDAKASSAMPGKAAILVA